MKHQAIKNPSKPQVIRRTQELLVFGVTTTAADIKEGECGSIHRCMERLAITRSLWELDPDCPNHHVKVDASAITFHYQGYHWEMAPIPKVTKKSLMLFDHERVPRITAKKQGVEFISQVKPHSYTVKAVRGKRIENTTRERQDQVNEARRQRIAVHRAAGQKTERTYDFRRRVAGMGNV